ncbi:MAG: NAD(+) synthase, partial [Planctomycetota bacterium]
MKRIKLAAAALNQTPLDWDRNAANIRAAIAAARAQQVHVLCLPELCICGYGCEDAFYSNGLPEMCLEVLHELLPETRGMIVPFGLPLRHRGGLFNCVALAANGKLAGFVAKQNLPGEGLHYEPRWFKPWPNDAVAEVEVAGQSYPMGDLMFECGGVRIGFEICEDAWVLDRPGGELAQQGVDLLLNPSASHFAFGKHPVRRQIVEAASRTFFCAYVYANLLGNEAGRAIYDGDTLVASLGELRACGPRFRFEDFTLASAVIDLDQIRTTRARSASFPVEVGRDLANVVEVPFDADEPEREVLPIDIPAWETSPAIKEEEFTRAVSLGLFDYLRKSRSQGFVVSLSGGADSSAVSMLCAMMVQFAVGQLGMDKFCKKLDYIQRLQSATTARDAVRELLTCVYQGTRNSSTTTLQAATDVAQGVGATFYTLDVDELVAGYTQRVSEAIGRPLTWERDDLTLQNIQARARGPSVWMLANLQNALLLATSNRSEAAVGYATMDGDTCGGLSPIAGIDKAFLRSWLRWLESEGPAELGPAPFLASINAQAPTAELRPAEEKQTDEDDLMPYDILDAIERAAIRDKLVPQECLDRLRSDFPDRDHD